MAIFATNNSQNKTNADSNMVIEFIHRRNIWYLYMGILVIYIIVRVFVWQNTTYLEDHDSVGYLNVTKMFQNFNITDLMNLGPDITPFYPFFSALCGLLVGQDEFGARLCSLLFSIGLFFAVIGIGKRFTSYSAILLALLIITFNAVLMRLSSSVLTEPSYTTVVYLGFWLFFSQYHNPTLKKGFLLGILFSLCFLNRTEGILFLVAIPCFQLVHFLFFSKGRYSYHKLIGWAFFFIFGFSLLSLPQIMHVSHKMGTFAINGRQAWGLILSNPDGKSYEEKIHGLDYSPKEVNLNYIQTHPDVIKSESSERLKHFVTKTIYHYTQLYQTHLSIFIGPLGIIFFGFGLLSLLKTDHCYALFLVLAFLGITLFGPAIWSVDMRTLMVSGPIIMLIEGIGIMFLSNLILEKVNLGARFLFLRKYLPLFIVMILLLCVAVPICVTLKTPSSDINRKISPLMGNLNSSFEPRYIEKPLSIFQIIQKSNMEKGKKPKVVSRKSYFPYKANAVRVMIPYTDYDGLVRYSQLNDVDYLFLDYGFIKDYPFLDRFQKGNVPDFQRLYSAPRYSSGKGLIELYRYIR